jgi:hypothetical protein
MPIQLASNIVPRNGNTWYLLEDVYLKGGFQVRATTADRDSIDPLNLKAGMLCLTQDTKTLWILGDDLVTWTQFATGGGNSTSFSRQVVVHDLGIMAGGASAQFTLQLGKTAMILVLAVTQPVLVEAFSTPAMNDSNPYRFLATADHLADDGSMLLSDGTVINLRRYAVFANMETPPTDNIYFRVTNQGATAVPVALTITFLPIEGLSQGSST